MVTSSRRPRRRLVRLVLPMLLGIGAVAAVLAGTAPPPLDPSDVMLPVRNHPWYDRSHHADDGFRNIWSPPREVPALRAAGWLLRRPFARKRNIPAPVRDLAPDSLRVPPDRLRITWLGHSSTLIQTAGHNLLLDPMFSRRASPFSFVGPERLAPAPLPVDSLPPVHYVLLSHDHYDHLDERTIRALIRHSDPVFLAPLGVGRILKDWGARRIVEMDWWQFADDAGFRFHCLPAKHFSGRRAFGNDETLWASWYIEHPTDSLRVYYAGDTAYASHFQEIRQRLGAPEVALLPIGAYLPRWFMKEVHVDPSEAVQAFTDLGARHFIPVHWGTFDMADEPLQEPPARLREAAPHLNGRLHLLDIAGSVSF